MKNEKITNKHIEEVAQHLAQFMKFTADEIAKALYKYEMDIDDDICMDNVTNGVIKIYGDAIIFKGFDHEYEGIDIREMRYLNDFACYCIMNPDWFAV